MAATVQDSIMPGRVFTPDVLLQLVIETALADTVISPDAAMSMLGKLMRYERDDIERLMAFIDNGNSSLGDYLDYTICYLSKEQFTRFVRRVESFYAELVELPGMGAHEAWEMLIGYHDGDPGETVEQMRAVLHVNAAVLDTLLSYRYFPLESVRHVIVQSFYASDHDDYKWGLKELAPELISFVTSRHEEVDQIVHLIRSEYLWHADYLALRLDGKLPDSPLESEQERLRRITLTRIDSLHSAPQGDAESAAEERRDSRVRVEDAFDNNDLDSLRVYAEHCEEFLACGHLTDRIIKSLRLAGHTEVAHLITPQHFDACRAVDEAIQNESSMAGDGSSRVTVRSLVLNNIEKLNTIVGDLGPVVSVIREHGVTEWEHIAAVRAERRIVTASLHDGVL
jgi:hypothetical protein